MTKSDASWKRRITKLFLFVIAMAVLLLAAVYTFTPSAEDFWTKTKNDLEARGEILDWEKHIPPAVPSEENLFEDPIAASLLPIKGAAISPNPLKVGSPQFPTGSEQLDRPFEFTLLKALPRASSPSETVNQPNLTSLDKWFEQWDETFAQLRKAGERRSVRLPGDFRNPITAPIPNFVAFRTLAQVLCSRAKLHLLLGDSTAALEDLDALSVVIRALNAAPGTLVSAMIQVALARMYVDVIEQGLSERLWRDAELKELGERLNRINLLESVKQGLRTERAAVCRHFAALANRGTDPLYATTARNLLAGSDDLFSIQGLFLRMSPAGWIRMNQANYALIVQDHIDAIDVTGQRVDLSKIEAGNLALRRLATRWSPHTALVPSVTPNFIKASVSTARSQSRVQFAGLACAIERYRMQFQSVPEQLSELQPELISSIPKSLFDGTPIVYRKTSDGWELTASDPNRTVPPDKDLTWNGR